MSSSLVRVLVVDDEPRVGELLRDVLMDLGYGVRLAVNGAEALEIAAGYHPHVVLLDLTLPEMPGEIVLERLREAEPHRPVIAITGDIDPERARATLAGGAFDCIAKPFDLSRLARVLEAAVVARG
jgi:DNA-binding NtrC family response regulator